MNESPFLAYNKDFVLFGTQHLIVLALMVMLSMGLPLFSRRFLQHSQKVKLARGMALLISFWVIIYDVILIYLGKFNYKTDLPLDICNLMGLLLPLFMWNPSKKIFPYFYFIILSGTFQAVLTPHLYNGFPNFIFLKYWFVHAGLIVFIIYVAGAFGYKVSLKDLWRAFLVIQLYVLGMYGVNYLLGSNYVYIMHKPPTASALDYLGPWPVYILVGEGIALVLFFIVWLLNRDKKSSN
ncbi:MAG: TIGR02206 family membrane protein [Bacteroidia bacterium]|nr:TIGR02206 family membrane protein [Bacteroidia bacterium]